MVLPTGIAVLFCHAQLQARGSTGCHNAARSVDHMSDSWAAAYLLFRSVYFDIMLLVSLPHCLIGVLRPKISDSELALLAI